MTTLPVGSRTFSALSALVVSLGLAGPAAAFYPIGGTSAFTLDIQFVRWALEDMDTNGDGEVRGDNEGVVITFERGPLGFTDDEVNEVMEAFEAWEQVPTSFAAFQYTFPVTQPLPNIAGMNLVSMVNADANDETPAEIEGAPSVIVDIMADMTAVTVLTGFLEDAVLISPDGTTQFMVEGGRIFDADMFFNADFFRDPPLGFPVQPDLTAFAMRQIGVMLGLSVSPVNNVEAEVVGQTTIFIESPVLPFRNVLGELDFIGSTPTMFPATFFVENESGSLDWGMRDLAPDDIAGISFLYPRSTSASFFSVSGTARTQSLGQSPSTPLLGGIVTAWLDTDGSGATARIPVYSTMTGLFEPVNDLRQRGNFRLPNMASVVETPAGDLIQANYTFTIQPVTELTFPFLEDVPDFGEPETFDSTHGPNSFGPAWPVPYTTAFPTEVFLKEGELFGAENADFGTPLAWDPVRRRVVDPRTGETLNQMLGKDEPFFGDESVVCPLLLGAQDFPAVTLLGSLRHFRDNYLLASAAGAAIADAYYQAGPAIVAFLKQHPMLLAIFGATLAVADFMLVYPVSWMALLAGCAAFVLLRRRRRIAAAVTTALALAVLGASTASATILPVSEQDLVAKADYVVTGRVVAIESEIIEAPEPKVWTTITLEVDEALKGRANKGGYVHLTVPGGVAGGMFTYIADLPGFAEDEEVVLFLRDQKSGGYGIVAGQRGKHRIATDPDTGEKYVVGANLHSSQGIQDVAEAQKKSDSEPVNAAPGVTLDAYRDFVRAAAK